MLFTYVLASALAFSAVLGRTAGPAPVRITYETEDQIQSQTVKQANIMDVNDRSSNLKYVMAIQSSSIWSEIKKRSLTINTQPLNEATVKKSPEDLSDQELAQLKQVCHDGLKCVAVDQLLVLKKVVEPTDDGQVSVRTAITKITEVLTQYTTEYHKDVYEYKEIQVSDDQTKVYQSVTTILEDNKELCQIDIIPVEETRPKKDDSNSDHTAVPGNGTTVNYNTIGNININNGTINDANINIGPNDTAVVTESPKSGSVTDDTSDEAITIFVVPAQQTADTSDGNLAESESVSKAPNDNVRDKRARQQNDAEDGGTFNRDHEPATVDHHPEHSTDNGTGTNGRQKSQGSQTADRSAHERAASIPDAYSDSDDVQSNSASVKNGSDSEAGTSDSDVDIMSSGSHNDGNVKKGYVVDGTLNNGNMVEYDDNRGIINTGNVSGCDAENGIINVGTVNNGPVNYGKSNKYTNNGTQAQFDSRDVQQYLSSIDKMYSTILERLA